MQYLKRITFPLVALLLLLSLFSKDAQSSVQTPEASHFAHLPLVTKPTEPMVEIRGVWVTRFDWTSNSGITTDQVDAIVDNIAAAGFNVIYFQVRGEGDALYESSYEPWSRRLTGTLGQNPGFDPFARLVQRAHALGIEVHAYINVYPVWGGCTPPPSNTNPQHLYYKLINAHGTTSGKNNGLQWVSSGSVLCNDYMRATPASVFLDNHILQVATELVTKYDVDGIHLDHIRYGASSASYDPVSNAAYAFESGTYTRTDWQRRQVNGTVSKFYDQIRPLKDDLWLSAAVWPVHVDKWGWNVTEGYSDYYQDSKAWLSGGYIDSISPMIYPGTFNCPDTSFWSYSVWETLVADFQAESAGRHVVPGIASGYCSFSELEQRINRARELGTAGHAIFSYGGLATNGYFDDLANGPYAEPAVVPSADWDR